MCTFYFPLLLSLCRLKETDPSMFPIGIAPQNRFANYFQLRITTECIAACTEVVAITIIMLFLSKEKKKMSEFWGALFNCSEPLTYANH